VLFGDRFKTPLATALKIEPGKLDDMMKDRRRIPPRVWLGLAAIIQDRAQTLPELKIAVLNAAEEAQPLDR